MSTVDNIFCSPEPCSLDVVNTFKLWKNPVLKECCPGLPGTHMKKDFFLIFFFHI